jgi:hypothetical protein
LLLARANLYKNFLRRKRKRKHRLRLADSNFCRKTNEEERKSSPKQLNKSRRYKHVKNCRKKPLLKAQEGLSRSKTKRNRLS